jgi:myo-inositol-1(or 4)-monophosphatase
MNVVKAPSDPAVPSAWADELRLALDVAARAGLLAVGLQDRLVSIEHKSATDVVTEADHQAEALIIGALRSAFPGDSFLAEESGRSTSDDIRTGRTWVIDPIDGTVNYANGIPLFCVSIALVEDGRPVVGVVRDPIRGESFAAVADGPATLDGRPIHASSKERLRDCVISLSLRGDRVVQRWPRVRSAVRVPRALGTAALSLAYVANGRFDAFVQQTGLSNWDIAAAGLIAERAGAVVSDATGGPWFDLDTPDRSIGLVAAPARHHAPILALLRD